MITLLHIYQKFKCSGPAARPPERLWDNSLPDITLLGDLPTPEVYKTNIKLEVQM